jgi:hypothetical protein
MLRELIISSVKFLITGAIILSALTCGPRPQPPLTSSGNGIPVPYGLKAETASHRATLYWSINRTKRDLISGYDIFIGDQSRIEDRTLWSKHPGSPYNPIPYPGDTDGDISRESIQLKNLDNGRTYLAEVRTVASNGVRSEPSNIIEFTPFARGVFIISSNHEARDGGFNFETETQFPGRDPNSDIYLYATETRIGLSAPYRLGAGLRDTKFFMPPSGDPLETIPIRKGQSIKVQTRDGIADLKIEEIMGQYPDIAVKISYLFHPARPQ